MADERNGSIVIEHTDFLSITPSERGLTLSAEPEALTLDTRDIFIKWHDVPTLIRALRETYASRPK